MNHVAMELTVRMGRETLKNSVIDATHKKMHKMLWKSVKRLTNFSLELVGKPPLISKNGDKTGNFLENEQKKKKKTVVKFQSEAF